MRAKKGLIAAVIACFLLVACGEPMSDDSTSELETEAQPDEGSEAIDGTQQSLVTCGAAGAFVSGATTCCKGLVKDRNSRCQYPTCKAVGAAGTASADGTSNCCFGLVLISGYCRTPTLSAKLCTVLDKVPTQSAPCCVGLVKDGFTGKCKRNAVLTCSSAKVSTCCYGKSVNTCTCYCPNPYYGL